MRVCGRGAAVDFHLCAQCCLTTAMQLSDHTHTYQATLAHADYAHTTPTQSDQFETPTNFTHTKQDSASSDTTHYPTRNATSVLLCSTPLLLTVSSLMQASVEKQQRGVRVEHCTLS